MVRLAAFLLSSLARFNDCPSCNESFDLPQVEPVARKHIANAGLSERVTAVSGDFFKDPLPKADVITMGMILHDWNLEKKMHLIRAAYDALPEGGALVAIEALNPATRRKRGAEAIFTSTPTAFTQSSTTASSE